MHVVESVLYLVSVENKQQQQLFSEYTGSVPMGCIAFQLDDTLMHFEWLELVEHHLPILFLDNC